MRRHLYLTALLWALFGAGVPNAEAQPVVAGTPDVATAQPRIGLVLSGGNARGLAHIGAIRALEEQGIRVDAITGTSMSAIIGALYASGKTPDELEEIALNLDWSRHLTTSHPARTSPSGANRKPGID